MCSDICDHSGYIELQLLTTQVPFPGDHRSPHTSTTGHMPRLEARHVSLLFATIARHMSMCLIYPGVPTS